jgi:hypothetical protein
MTWVIVPVVGMSCVLRIWRFGMVPPRSAEAFGCPGEGK